MEADIQNYLPTFMFRDPVACCLSSQQFMYYTDLTLQVLRYFAS